VTAADVTVRPYCGCLGAVEEISVRGDNDTTTLHVSGAPQPTTRITLTENQPALLRSTTAVLFRSAAVLEPTVGHTVDVLSPFIPVLCCHSD